MQPAPATSTGRGLYEVTLSPLGDAQCTWPARRKVLRDVQGQGRSISSAETLKTIGLSYADLKNFAVQITPDGKTLFVTNSA